jgi:Ca2+-binding RTX toxin-like protein
MKNIGTRAHGHLCRQYGHVLRKVRLITHLQRSGIDIRVLKKSFQNSRKQFKKWWKPVTLGAGEKRGNYVSSLEQLEPRMLLAADVWSVDLSELDAYADNATLRMNADSTRLELVDGDAAIVLASKMLSSMNPTITSAQFTGGDRNDAFVIQVSPADVQSFLPHGISFIAGEGDDDTVTNATDLLVWKITASGVGNVGTMANPSTFSFSGVESISSDGLTGTIDFSGYGSGVTVDLTQESATGLSGKTLGFQNVVGSPYEDTIIGNSLDNRFIGGGGDDTLTGGVGDDTYVFSTTSGNDSITEKSDTDGTEGSDTFDFSADSSDLTVTVKSDGTYALTHASHVVTASNIENIIGGDGVNTLDYSDYSSGVTVNLGEDTATLFHSVQRFQNVTGTAFKDVLRGSSSDNVIHGGSGDDVIRGGAGQDTLHGGLDTDTVNERINADITLTDSTLIIGSVTEIISGFEKALLTGGMDANTIDASAFTLGGVTLDGGASVYFDDVLSGGLPTTNKLRLNLSKSPTSVALAKLNNGQGVGTVSGIDFQIALRDGNTRIDVNLDTHAAQPCKMC